MAKVQRSEKIKFCPECNKEPALCQTLINCWVYECMSCGRYSPLMPADTPQEAGESWNREQVALENLS